MRASITVLLSLLATACTSYLPPVQTPPAESPTLASSPHLPPGHGRLVIDVVDGPTDVFELNAYRRRIRTRRGRLRTVTRTARSLLCTSPCAVDIPYGRYVLGFPMHGGGRRLERVLMNVSPQPTVHRRRLGNYWDAGPGLPLGVVGATFGGIAMVIGVVFLPIGAAQGDDGMALAGGINLGAGVVLLVAGILGLALDPAVEEPGSGVTFPLQ